MIPKFFIHGYVDPVFEMSLLIRFHGFREESFQSFDDRVFVGSDGSTRRAWVIAPCCQEEFRWVIVGPSDNFADESGGSRCDDAAHVRDVVEKFSHFFISYFLFFDFGHCDS